MNPDYGYQLYYAQRPRPRAEMIAGEARLGRQAAAVARGSRRLAARATAPAIMAVAAIRSAAGRPAARHAPCQGEAR